MSDGLVALGALLVTFGLVFGGIATAADLLGRYQCGKYEDMTGLKTEWAAYSMCYIHDPDLGVISYEERKAAITAERLKSK